MTAIDELRTQLEKLCWPKPQSGTVYRGPADFVLQHGEVFEPVPYPHDTVPQGAERACFGNAIILGDLFDLAYVEGYTLSPVEGAEFPIHHAWNVVTGMDYLVDSTWLNTGLAYLGVRFHIGRADDATWNGDANVLDDFLRHWPLLQERWQGEDFDREWEPTEMLLKCRRYAAEAAAS